MAAVNTHRQSPISGDAYIELGRACAACRTEADFQRIVRTLVRPLMPHGSLLAVLGRLDLEHLEITALLGVDHPEAHIQLVPRLVNIRERPVIQAWIDTRMPLVLQLPADADRMSERERMEIVVFDLRRIAVYGVLDSKARTGSYFSFSQVDPSLDAGGVCETLRLIVPLLHVAFVNISAGLQQGGAASALTALEGELLRWVQAGKTNAEIGRIRGRSAATVRNQLHKVYRKLGVSTRLEAVRLLAGP